MNNQVVMYFHGGSKNHGCEAIIRSTAKLFSNKMITFSMYPEEDKEYHLDDVADIRYDKTTHLKKPSFEYYRAALETKLKGTYEYRTYYQWQDFFKSVTKNTVYLSTGGDNYCYSDLDKLRYFNLLIHKRGGKTVLWGCSIDPDKIAGTVIEDLKRYDAIVAREPLTVAALREKGITENVVQFPDPAFQLDEVRLSLPDHFVEKNMVGINVSPLVISKEVNANAVLNNYVELIRYILENTDMGIVLIPHVVKNENNDIIALKAIKQFFPNEDRVVELPDLNCMEIKGYISRCRFVVAARTHASIAAYSTCVPTLVVGYSIKSKGIATDLFGTDQNYVIPVEQLTDKENLTEAFQWLMNNEKNVHDHLAEMIPDYKAKCFEAAEFVEGL